MWWEQGCGPSSDNKNAKSQCSKFVVVFQIWTQVQDVEGKFVIHFKFKVDYTSQKNHKLGKSPILTSILFKGWNEITPYYIV